MIDREPTLNAGAGERPPSKARRRPRLRPLAVDAAGVAELLGVSRGHVDMLDRTGQIPQARRLGRRKLWSVRELARWVDAGMPSRAKWERFASLSTNSR